MKTLIIGCGYVGRTLAQRLREVGHEIGAWTYSRASADELAALGFEKVISGSVADEALWKGLAVYDQVVHCASSGGGGPEAYREVFVEGARFMCVHQPQARKLFVSSTSVYGQNDGEIVTEDSDAEPGVQTSKILREAERLALYGGSVVVRSAGIYGPGRARLFEKARSGAAVIEGDGSRWINQIHRDDLVAAIAHLLRQGQAGQIYNASDGKPVTYLGYYRQVCALLDRPLPPFGLVNTERKRGLTNKRVAIDKLLSTAWAPFHPNFVEALREIMKAEPGSRSGHSPR